MKRIMMTALSLAMVFSLAACSSGGSSGTPSASAPASASASAAEPAVNPLEAQKSADILAAGEAVNPDGTVKKILVVVDMQKDFVDGALGTAEAEAIVPAVVAKIEQYKAAGDTIIATRDTHQTDYLETQEGRNLPYEHCIENSDGWLLNTEVADAMPEDATYINKPTFGSTELVDVIGDYVAEYGQQYVQVELIGLCTDICVVSNALMLKGFYYEMPISLDSSCCAGVTPESHEAALTTMRMCQIAVS